MYHDAAGYHGSDGPLVVSDAMITSLSEAFVVAGAELSHKFTDVNARFQQGMFNVLCISKSFKVYFDDKLIILIVIFITKLWYYRVSAIKYSAVM